VTEAGAYDGNYNDKKRSFILVCPQQQNVYSNMIIGTATLDRLVVHYIRYSEDGNLTGGYFAYSFMASAP